MDTVRAAFIRWLALEKWREIEDLRSTLGMGLDQAIEETAHFVNRGVYRLLWTERWKAEVRPELAGAADGKLFEAIERAAATALQEEEAERRSRGDRPLEEDPEYKAFVDRNLERLLRQGDLGVGP